MDDASDAHGDEATRVTIQGIRANPLDSSPPALPARRGGAGCPARPDRSRGGVDDTTDVEPSAAYSSESADLVELSGIGTGAPPGPELDDARGVLRAAGGPNDREPRPLLRAVRLEIVGTRRRVPGSREMGTVSHGERGVARTHELLRSSRRLPIEDGTAAGAERAAAARAGRRVRRTPPERRLTERHVHHHSASLQATRQPCGKFPRAEDRARYVRGMFVRRRHAVAAVLAVALLTTGCGSPASSPTAEPTATAPSPTDSDTAAFAAAEATYRAYVDALNAVDLSDPTTFEPVYALTTGDVQEADRRNLSQFNAEGVAVSGESVIMRVEYNAQSRSLHACLDVSTVALTAPDGTSLVDAERRDTQSLKVSFDEAGTRIARIEVEDTARC